MGVGNTKFIFVLGFMLGIAIFTLGAVSLGYARPNIENGIESPLEQAHDSNLGNILEALMGEAKDLPSPCDRISEDQIFVFSDQIIIDFKDAEWATFTDTNSMDPVIDFGANAIEYVPKNESEICVGDIVSYKSSFADGVLIHRVVEIGYDNNGWYAIMKGDNNAYRDPGRIRFDQLKRVVIAIIY